MPVNFKIKIKHGTAEFEAEGTQKFIEAKLKEFRSILSLPKSGKTEKAIAKNGRKNRKAKASYPQEAIKPLKDYLKKSKPKTHLETLLTIAKHQVQHFNADRFTNKDLSSAATAVGKKLGNISALLKTALKSKKIKKLGKGTWQLVAGKAQTSKPTKKAQSKEATPVKPTPTPKVKPAKAKSKAKPALKLKGKMGTAKTKAKPVPKSMPTYKPTNASEAQSVEQ